MPEPLDVLIVDDDQNMRATLMEILREDGYFVRSASTGEEAVELCRRYWFRVILMDMRMPGLDGISAYRQIRQHCKRSQIILMSAYGSEGLERSALDAGMLAFLQKPLDLEVVMNLLTEVMSTSVLFVVPAASSLREFEPSIVRSGFRVTFADNRNEAEQLLRQIHYDVLVVDCDGLGQPHAAIEALRAKAGDTRLIAVCAAPTWDQLRTQSAVNEAELLRKPVALDTLISLLERVKCARIGMPPPP